MLPLSLGYFAITCAGVNKLVGFEFGALEFGALEFGALEFASMGLLYILVVRLVCAVVVVVVVVAIVAHVVVLVWVAVKSNGGTCSVEDGVIVEGGKIF